MRGFKFKLQWGQKFTSKKRELKNVMIFLQYISDKKKIKNSSIYFHRGWGEGGREVEYFVLSSFCWMKYSFYKKYINM